MSDETEAIEQRFAELERRIAADAATVEAAKKLLTEAKENETARLGHLVNTINKVFTDHKSSMTDILGAIGILQIQWSAAFIAGKDTMDALTE